MRKNKYLAVTVVIAILCMLFQNVFVYAVENISFESSFDTAEDRTKTVSVANGKSFPVTYEAGLGGKSNNDYAIKLTAERKDTQDISSTALSPAFDLPYYSYKSFTSSGSQVIEGSLLYGGNVQSAKLDCYMNKTGNFTEGDKILYSFIEIKNGSVYVLGNDTGIFCGKDEWLDFAVVENYNISDLKIFINGKRIKTNLSGHQIYGNRWTQAKINFDENATGVGYIALDNIKIYTGDYIPEFSCDDIELKVNGSISNQYENVGDVLSASVSAYGEQNEKGMLALAVYDDNGKLEKVITDTKEANGETGYNVSYTLERTENISIKAMFWDADKMKPYAKPVSFIKKKPAPVVDAVYCNYMLNSEDDFTFFTESGAGNSITYEEETVASITNGFVRFTRKTGDRFYAYVEPGRTAENVVISADIRLNSLSPSFKYTVGDGLSGSSNIFTTALQISNGKINNTYSVPLNKWNTIAVALNTKTKKVEIYLNGKCVSKSNYVDGSFNYLTQFRFECVPSTQNGYFDVDNIRIYSGTTPVDIGDEPPISFNRFDAVDNATMFLAGKRAVQTYSNMYFDGSDKSELSNKCINYDDETLLPQDVFCKLFDKTVSVSGGKITVSDGTVMNVGSRILTKANTSKRALSNPPEEHNGIVYIPAVGYGNAVLSSTQFADDGHGMLIVGNGLDTSDMRMKRANLYMFFDRKSPNELKECLSQNTENLTKHPRLMITSDDVVRLKAECVTKSTRDEKKYAWYKKVKEEADNFVSTEPYTYYLSGGTLRNAATGAAYRMETLSFMYLLTKQKIYLTRALAELDAVTKFPDWGTQSFLDTSALASGAALCYDWLYEYMTDAQRENYANKIQELSVEQARLAYEGKAPFNDFFWNTETNWGIIANAGVVNAILATAEYNTDECMITLNYALRAMESAWYRFAPDGAWHEGAGYWSYMLGHLSKFMACYKTAMGEDFGAEYKGLNKYGYFQCYVTGPDGLPNNFHDADSEIIQNEGQFLLAKIYNDNELMRYRKLQMENNSNIIPSVEDLIWYDVSQTDNDAPIKLDKVSYFRETELVSIREDWDSRESSWLSFHGGKLNGAHDHIDAGTFVYSIGGERWAIDLGKEPLRYENPDPATQAGYSVFNYYRARAEGHNSVVINPSDSLEMNLSSNSKVSVPQEKENYTFSTVDLSDAYNENANSYIRGFKMSDKLRTLTVRDEISLKKSSLLYWFMHTDGAVEIVDNNTALITKNGKTLKVQVSSNANYVLSVEKAESLPSSPKFEMTENTGVSKLTIKSGNASGNVNITVKMSLSNEVGSNSGVDNSAISTW